MLSRILDALDAMSTQYKSPLADVDMRAPLAPDDRSVAGQIKKRPIAVAVCGGLLLVAFATQPMNGFVQGGSPRVQPDAVTNEGTAADLPASFKACLSHRGSGDWQLRESCQAVAVTLHDPGDAKTASRKSAP